MATKTKRPASGKIYDLVIEVDGKKFGLRSTFNPDRGTPFGDIDVFDHGTGEYLDEICQMSLPAEGDEDSGDLKRIKEYIHENLVH